MPCFKLLTNIPNSKIPKDFVNKIIPVLARTVNKEAYRFTCVVAGDCHVSFGGDSTTPGATATLESIGNVDSEANKVIAKEVSDFIHTELGVHPDRRRNKRNLQDGMNTDTDRDDLDFGFFMSIYDIQGTNIVKGGTTFG